MNLRHILRQWAKSPGFAAVAILTLALGIGANTAIFSLVYGLLLQPLPYREADQLVQVHESVPARGVDRVPVAVPNLVDWQRQSASFEGLAGLRHAEYNLTGQGEPRRITGARVTANLFSLLGANPLLGRTFTAEEEAFGKHFVVLLSESYWRSSFGADPGVLGRSLLLDGGSYTVIGVMPVEMRLPSRNTQVWTPAGFEPVELEQRGNHSWRVMGRLKPGVTLDQAKVEMNGIARRLGEQFEDARDFGVTVIGLREELVGELRLPLLILLGAVGCVLLIACANVANLMLARSAARAREFAVRAALGASRGDVIRQLLSESLVLSLAGGVLGVLLAWWGVTGFVGWLPEGHLLSTGQINGSVLAFTLGVSLLTGLGFGLVPAWQVWRTDLTEVLKDSGRGTTEGLRRNRLRNALVVVEVALALILLVGAGLLLRSFARAQRVDPGFKTEHLLTATLALTDQKYPTEPQKAQAILGMVEQVAALPGVESAAAVFGLPFGRMQSKVTFRIEGRPAPAAHEPDNANYRQITSGYFRTLGATLLGGRDFELRDGPDSPRVVIVNESFLRTFFPGGAPGQVPSARVSLDGTNNWIQIVGVVRDIRDGGLTQPAEPQMFMPMSQQCWGLASLVIRTRGSSETLEGPVRRAVLAIDGEQALDQMRSMESMVDDTLAQRRLQAVLLGAFSALALVLSAVGIYGVMAWSVSRRTQEIGIRMALGAQWSDVRRLVMGQGMALTFLGVALGLLGGVGLARFLAGLLYEIQPHDPPTFGWVTVILVGVSWVACWIPARRAARVDPLVALRTE